MFNSINKEAVVAKEEVRLDAYEHCDLIKLNFAIYP